MPLPDIKPRPPDARCPRHLAEALVRAWDVASELRRFVEEEGRHDGERPEGEPGHIPATPEHG